MYIWTNFLRNSPNPLRIVQELFPYATHGVSSLLLGWESQHRALANRKRWCLTTNGGFLVKSFYKFLNHRGIRCPTNLIWKSSCPKKISLFNWLAWDNNILTFENLATRRCNRLPNPTCLLCHAAVESVDHLFLWCPFAERIWNFIYQVFNLSSPPNSMRELWSQWRLQVPSPAIDTRDLLLRL